MKIVFTINLILVFSPILAQELPDGLVPPNGIKLKDNLYIDKTEIANIHWLEFMHYVNIDSSQAVYKSNLPDTTVWSLIAGFDSTWGNFYFRYPKNRYKPVVGLTLEQAKRFNEWRSHAATIGFNEKSANKLHRNKIDTVILKYRLPTPEEWRLAAYGDLVDTYGYKKLPYQKPELALNDMETAELQEKFGDSLDIKKLKNDMKKYLKVKRTAFQLLPDEIPDFVTIRDLTPRLITSGPKNYLGLHHTIGNVAEMTSDPNILLGASWLNKISKLYFNQKIYWDGKPKVWAGFRSVCEVSIIYSE